MYKILFGTLPPNHWVNNVKKLPHDIHIIDFNDIGIVKKYIIDNTIDILIAMTKQQNFFVIDNYDVLKKYTPYVLYNKNKDTIDLLNDKHQFYTFMRNNKFGHYVPITYISCVGGKQIMYNKYKFPCIYKLCVSSGGAFSCVIDRQSELNEVLVDKTKNYVVQEYVVGCDEYSAHLYVYRGVIKFSRFYHLYNNAKNYIQKGRMIEYDVVEVPSYIDIMEDIFRRLKFTGFACVDYKVCDNGVIKIFEINPRPGATIVSNVDDFNEMINVCVEVGDSE